MEAQTAAERTRHQHGLIVGIVGLLTQLIEDGGRFPEFGFGESDVQHEPVQVPDQGNHNFAQSGIVGALHDREYGGSYILVPANRRVTRCDHVLSLRDP